MSFGLYDKNNYEANWFGWAAGPAPGKSGAGALGPLSSARRTDWMSGLDVNGT